MSDSNSLKPLLLPHSGVRRWLLSESTRLQLAVWGVALPLLIVSLLTALVWGRDGGIGWDELILLAIHKTLQPSLDTLAAVLSELGVYRGVFPAVIAIAVGLLAARRWRLLIYVLTVAVGEMLINRTAKILIHRPRPHLWETPYPQHTDFAFPSGHAMASMTFAVIVIVLTWRSRWNWVVTGLSSLFVAGVSWSRLYLGVHYPSDILAGWFAAIAWATVVNLALLSQQPVEDDDTQNPSGASNST
ncbi:MAG: phosphatase PAP2 family protein [Oscillatoriales cyanobacterium C42_A2020_001]|nr:phosphatase PAP2 family protein [Leptolyngbyaceae cyanobacterium C42_A2020_001]